MNFSWIFWIEDLVSGVFNFKGFGLETEFWGLIGRSQLEIIWRLDVGLLGFKLILFFWFSVNLILIIFWVFNLELSIGFRNLGLWLGMLPGFVWVWFFKFDIGTGSG